MLGSGPLGSRPLGSMPEDIFAPRTFEFLLQTEFLENTGKTNEGAVVRALLLSWVEIFQTLERQPHRIYEFTQDPRKFEEFIAASYELDGYSVVLTPRSGDGGRDVIAEKAGFGAIRILDQCKAFKLGHLVSHNDTRAMLGVLHSDSNASKAIISTTSDFAPGIQSDVGIQKFVPNRLELRNGKSLVDWFSQVNGKHEKK